MSLAKLSATKSTRKEFVCATCRETIPKGSSVVRWTVGFRSRNVQTAHDTPKCFPKPSRRESSMVSEVYAAQEDFSVDDLETADDINSALESVKEACDSVISQYEENPTYDNNSDLQERVSQLESARDELDNWENEVDPSEPTDDIWDEDVYESLEQHREAWIDSMREAAQAAVDGMELP